jgi:hypothetical protein
MKNSRIVGCCGLLAVLLAGLLMTGCGTPRPQAWNVSVVKLSNRSIRVDLIGVTEADKPYWEGYNLDKYWSIDGDLRRKNAQPLTQFLKTGEAWEVSLTDPKWQEWLDRGATELLVLADLPGHFEPGSADPRRRFLPLTKGAWEKTKRTKHHILDIEIQDSMINIVTPPAAK